MRHYVFSFSTIQTLFFSLLVLLLPTQFGKHFWPNFAFIDGIRVDYLSPTVYMTDVITIALILVWFIDAIKYRKPFYLPQASYSAFLMLLLVTIIFSSNQLSGMYSFIKFLEYSWIFFYVASSIENKITMRVLAGLFAASTIGESLLAVFQYVTQGSIGGLWYFLGERFFTSASPGIANASLNGALVLRAYGTFSHPNVLAGYLIISMILIFFYLYPTRNYAVRILASSALLLGTAALILTLSRVAIALWILFISIFFVSQLVGNKLKKHNLYRWLFLTLLLLVVFLHILAPRFLETSFNEEAFTQREKLIDSAIHMGAARPVVGVGPGNFLIALSDYLQQHNALPYSLQPVHNIVLLVFVETGIFGLIFFLTLLGKTYKRLLEKSRKKNALPITLCLSVIIILGMNDHYWITLQQGQLLAALILGLAWKKAFHNVPFG